MKRGAVEAPSVINGITELGKSTVKFFGAVALGAVLMTAKDGISSALAEVKTPTPVIEATALTVPDPPFVMNQRTLQRIAVVDENRHFVTGLQAAPGAFLIPPNILSENECEALDMVGMTEDTRLRVTRAKVRSVDADRAAIITSATNTDILPGQASIPMAENTDLLDTQGAAVYTAGPGTKRGMRQGTAIETALVLGKDWAKKPHLIVGIGEDTNDDGRLEVSAGSDEQNVAYLGQGIYDSRGGLLAMAGAGVSMTTAAAEHEFNVRLDVEAADQRITAVPVIRLNEYYLSRLLDPTTVYNRPTTSNC